MSSSNLRMVGVLRGALIGLMAALVPCILLAAFLARAYLGYVLGFFVAGLLLVRLGFQVWHCPRCGKPFFRAGTWSGPNMFSRRCAHCGLSDSPEDSSPIFGSNNQSDDEANKG